MEPLLLIPLGSDPPPGDQEVRAAGESPYSFSTEPLFLIPYSFPARPAPREPGDQARRDAPHFFSREPVFLIPSGSDRSPGKPRDRARRDALHVFSREPVFLVPSGSDRSPGSQEIGLAGMHCTFFSREPLFLIPFVSRTPLAAPDFLQQFFLSSSPQRDSGILAVRKTGASVLPLLPPPS